MKPSNPTPTGNSSPTLSDSARTLNELLRYARYMLDDVALTSPDADARALFTAAVNAEPTDIIFRGDEPYTDEAGRRHLAKMLVRRVAREPLQHILGTAPVMSLELRVESDVFVPQPEMELFAQRAIDRVHELVANGVVKPKIVDPCTGSGALASAITDTVPEADIVAMEPFERARTQATENIGTYGDGRVRLIAGNVTDDQLTDDGSELADWVGEVDVVVPNPPYMPGDTEVTPEARADPHSAAFDGNDGLDVIRPMMDPVNALVRSDGVIGIGHDDSSGGDVSSLLRDTWNYADVEVRRDFADRGRFTMGCKN